MATVLVTGYLVDTFVHKYMYMYMQLVSMSSSKQKLHYPDINVRVGLQPSWNDRCFAEDSRVLLGGGCSASLYAFQNQPGYFYPELDFIVPLAYHLPFSFFHRIVCLPWQWTHWLECSPTPLTPFLIIPLSSGQQLLAPCSQPQLLWQSHLLRWALLPDSPNCCMMPSWRRMLLLAWCWWACKRRAAN